MLLHCNHSKQSPSKASTSFYLFSPAQVASLCSAQSSKLADLPSPFASNCAGQPLNNDAEGKKWLTEGLKSKAGAAFIVEPTENMMSIGTEADSLGFHSLKDLPNDFPGTASKLAVRHNHQHSFINLNIGSKGSPTAAQPTSQSAGSKKRKYWAFAGQKRLGDSCEQSPSAGSCSSTSSRRQLLGCKKLKLSPTTDVNQSVEFPNQVSAEIESSQQQKQQFEASSKGSPAESSSINLFCSEESIIMESLPSFAREQSALEISEFQPTSKERQSQLGGLNSICGIVNRQEDRVPTQGSRSWHLSDVEEDIKEIQSRVGAIWMR